MDWLLDQGCIRLVSREANHARNTRLASKQAALILLQNRPRVDRISQRTKTILFDKRAAATSFHAT
jgi:hypothetical protein